MARAITVAVLVVALLGTGCASVRVEPVENAFGSRGKTLDL